MIYTFVHPIRGYGINISAFTRCKRFLVRFYEVLRIRILSCQTKSLIHRFHHLVKARPHSYCSLIWTWHFISFLIVIHFVDPHLDSAIAQYKRNYQNDRQNYTHRENKKPKPLNLPAITRDILTPSTSLCCIFYQTKAVTNVERSGHLKR